MTGTLIRRACATLAVMGAAVGMAAVPAGAAPVAGERAATQVTACPAGWGSLAKTAGGGTQEPLRNVRTGRHDCFDRMVVDVPGAGSGVGYTVQYVDRLHQDGSGRHIPVAGGAVLEVRVAAPSYDPETGAATYPGRVALPLPGVDLTGYRTFRDTRFAGSFEGDTQIGLGVRARLPFRVLQLDDRVIVDVAHSWTATR
ncbi:AMIN-like domain-containing (lipo)protein [Streptomyces sp. DT190]|uniref:AMIN-like domain-containing (lipo)protein n=1 Tax=unclassified Streptomyces TaxID=2593676 RepID=UPI003CED6F12